MLVKKERFINCCHMDYCDNLAEVLIENDKIYEIEGKDTKTPQKFYMCEECAKELSEKLSTLFVPKTIKSVYNKSDKFNAYSKTDKFNI